MISTLLGAIVTIPKSDWHTVRDGYRYKVVGIVGEIALLQPAEGTGWLQPLQVKRTLLCPEDKREIKELILGGYVSPRTGERNIPYSSR